uniref:Uncharacterized protein n=1 Tax=Arion vulgaris TaxID=1028688 RepID=A0A0B6ZIA3_9EUPU
MVPQSYELSFGLTVVVIFTCIMLFILAINLFVAILRFVFRIIGRIFGTVRKSSAESSEAINNEHSLKTESYSNEANRKDMESSTNNRGKPGTLSPNTSSVNKAENEANKADIPTVTMRKPKSKVKS